MKVKEFLTKKLGELRSRLDTLDAEMIAADSKEARAQIGETMKQIRAEIAETETMLADIDEPKDTTPAPAGDPAIRAAVVGESENRNGSVKGDIEARAKALTTDGHFSMPASEARSVLVSSGELATPTAVNGISDPMSSVSSIVDMVEVEDMTGFGTFQEAYMKAWQEADAGTEGSAANSDDPDFCIVTDTPHIINVISYISKQVRKQTPLQYLAKVQQGAAIALKKKVASWIVSGNGTTAIYGICNAVDKDNDSMIQVVNKSSDIDDKTLREIVFAYGGDDNLFGGDGVILILNKKDLVAFGDVRSSTTKQAVYEIIPEGTNPNTGVIKDGGLSVRYCINANATAFVDAEATEAGVPTMIVGHPRNYKLGLFGDYEITVSEDYKFSEGLLAVRGEVLVAGNVIKDKGFVVVKKVTSNP